MDDYSGNYSDPQSLHKYLYCHANPVNRRDPSGMISVIESITIAIIIVVALMSVTGIHDVAHHGKYVLRERRETTEGIEAITLLDPGLKEQIYRDAVGTINPEVLKLNMEFWHEHAELNKAVTLYNLKTEQTLLEAVDFSYHSLEATEIGLGVAGALAASPIFWSKPHPPSNPLHWDTISKNAMLSAGKGEAKAVYTNAYLSTVTNGRCTARMAPDIAVVMPNGKIRIIEILSPPPQTYNKLLEKGWEYKRVLGDTLEYYNILKIGEIAP
jgi:hypothetical protein